MDPHASVTLSPTTAGLAPASPEPALAPGTVIGSYRLERVVGQGGMAMVYEATHQVLPRRVALKVMRTALLAEAPRMRLLREACVLAGLRHPAIVAVHDAGVNSHGRSTIDGSSCPMVARGWRWTSSRGRPSPIA